jgi:PTS system fructose-specific IIC component
MATFDFGGPVNKTMSLFADGLLVSGVYGPEAVKFVGSMIPPFGITLSFLLTRHKYTRAETEALKAAFPDGHLHDYGGVIPIAARDLLRVVGSCVVASAVAGGLIMTWGVESPVPHGGCLWCRCSPIRCCLPGAGDWDGYLRRDAVAVEKTGHRTRRRV